MSNNLIVRDLLHGGKEDTVLKLSLIRFDAKWGRFAELNMLTMSQIWDKIEIFWS